jgi:uncharacterized membrane protein
MAFTLLITAFGAGLFAHTEHYFLSWQHQFFSILCHQDPVRSFVINGTPMAVCSRCFGIYSFFMAGILLMPVYMVVRRFSLKTEKKWLIAAILLNLADVLTNFLGIWSNTLITRFVLGAFLGLSAALILANEFFTLTKSEY